MARKPVTAKTAQSVVKTDTKVVVCLNLAHSLVFDVGNKKIKINGSNENLRGANEGILSIGKFGESIIDRQDWEEIVRQYGNMTIFKSGLIFAQNDTASARAKAKELKDTRHGLEPVDPKRTTTKEDSK